MPAWPNWFHTFDDGDAIGTGEKIPLFVIGVDDQTAETRLHQIRVVYVKWFLKVVSQVPQLSKRGL